MRLAAVLAVALTAMLLATLPAASSPVPQQLSCEELPGAIVGTDESETLVGTDGDDVIAGLGGDDTILGLEGKDYLCGGPGADVLFGGGGSDVLVGDVGADEMHGGRGKDWLSFEGQRRGVVVDLRTGTAVSRSGDDVFTSIRHVLGSDAHDVIRGDRRRNLLRGAYGNDRIIGGRGDDVAHGGWGEDRIWGGAGDDAAHGGPDTDRCSAETQSRCEISRG